MPPSSMQLQHILCSRFVLQGSPNYFCNIFDAVVSASPLLNQKPCFCVVCGTTLLAFDIILIGRAHNSVFTEWTLPQFLKYWAHVAPGITPYLEFFCPHITTVFTTFMCTTRSSSRSRWRWLPFLKKTQSNLFRIKEKNQNPLLE